MISTHLNTNKIQEFESLKKLSMESLKDKVALITGAGKGIEKAVRPLQNKLLII